MELFDTAEINGAGPDTESAAVIGELLSRLEGISLNARDNALHALLYGCSVHSPVSPPRPAIISFAHKVIAAAESAGDITTETARCLAEKVCNDRLDPDTEQVKIAAFKVMREFDRLRGLLRFKPDREDCYTAICSPDHFVLPLLADHFRQRFGKKSWAIIDERRNFILTCKNGKLPVLRPLGAKEKVQENNTVQGSAEHNCATQNSDEWEALWKNYHRSINNEDRANPKLQKQFMPSRYWKYLAEFR